MRVFEGQGDVEPRLQIVILVIHRFSVCKLTYSLKCICKPGIYCIDPLAPLWSLVPLHRAMKNWSALTTCSQLRLDEVMLCFLLPALHCRQVPFRGLHSAMPLHFCGFFDDDFTSYNTPQT